MSGGEGPILAQRIIYTALALLVSTLVLEVAVSILCSIWPWLASLLLVGGLILLVRSRSRGW